jgi:hypothetical protein
MEFPLMKSGNALAATALFAAALCGQPAGPPYPPSPVLRGITLDWTTHQRDAIGSDNWQLTWADDGHQYAAWGDGGGFGGTNSAGRVSLGVARIEGAPDGYRGVNVWGGNGALYPATFEGKSWGMISTGGALYMWVVPKSLLADMQSEARLYRSPDHGATWQPADWAFTRADGLTIPTICQFGKDNNGARDRYVYHYFISPRDASGYNIQRPGAIYLARSPETELMHHAAYEFFAGMSGGRPSWTRDLAAKAPVFEDRENGVGWVSSVTYVHGLRRYILMCEHTSSSRGNFGMFDAPEPWGPWTMVTYLNESEGNYFGAGHVEPNTFFWNIPVKWQSLDGKRFTIVFTGAGRGKNNDSFNLVSGEFLLR